MHRHTFFAKQIGQVLDHVPVGEGSRRRSQQAFPAVLIDDIQDPEHFSVVRAVLHEIITPDVVGKLRP